MMTLRRRRRDAVTRVPRNALWVRASSSNGDRAPVAYSSRTMGAQVRPAESFATLIRSEARRSHRGDTDCSQRHLHPARRIERGRPRGRSEGVLMAKPVPHVGSNEAGGYADPEYKPVNPRSW